MHINFTRFFSFLLLKEVKLGSPDYKDVPSEEAFEDFVARIEHYKQAYETISFDEDK